MKFWKEARRAAPERLLARVSERAMKAYGKVRRDGREDRRGIKIAETVKGRGNATDD